MENILISLDPSFSRTGICVIDLFDKKIYFETASCKIGEKQFENVVHAAQNIVNQLKTIFIKYTDNKKYSLVSEAPLPLSCMSSALYSLGTLIYNTFEPSVVKMYNPATLKSKIHGRKYDKKDSLNLAEKYIKILSNSGYIILSELGTKKKIPHDCAEAFLYAWLYLHDSGHIDFQFDNSDEIKKFKDRVKELKKKERELLKLNLDINKGV